MNSEDITKDLTDSEKLDWLIKELVTLKAVVEDRLKDTRPIWQAINLRTERIEETLLDIKEQIGTLARRDLEREAAYSRLS